MRRLAAALEQARTTRSRIAKEEAIGGVLAALAREGEGDVALATAARLAAGRALPVGDGRKLGIGWRMLADVAIAQTGRTGAELWELTRETGDLGEALCLALERVPGASERAGVPLPEVAALMGALAGTSRREDKRSTLDDAFSRATPLEAKYLAKAILGENRIGAQAGVVESSIARGFGVPLAEVRRAAALVTDPGDLAVLVARGRLGEARLAIGRPVAYMLATPMESVAGPIDPAAFVVEDKIDGVRAQVHKRADAVLVFARGLDDVTRAFPEVCAAFAAAKGDVALDGELVVTAPDGRPRPFMALQNRLGRVAPSAEVIADNPVTFIAYDILADGEQDLLALPWTERRARLEAFAKDRGPSGAFAVNPVGPLSDMDARFDEARARGHEGLVLKRPDAAYEAGRRGQAWIKVKRAFATLDVVVTAVEQGHGKRAGALSDYTFAVWRRGAEGEESELVNVGKAYSGLTDAEIETMGARFEAMTTETYGSVRSVRPEVVLEVAFDGIQRSKRHKSGFALRFPRIARIRDDKRPEDADTLAAVEALYAAQLESGHREERKERTRERKKPSAGRVREGRLRVASSQLNLFGEDGDESGARVDRGRPGPGRGS